MSGLQLFKFTKHPVEDVWMPPLSEEQIARLVVKPGGVEFVERYWRTHEDMIADAARDPLKHGFEPPYWRDVRSMIGRKAITAMLGGNGTGKTEFGGKIAMEQLMLRKGAKVLCVAANADVSKQLQQPAVYKYLPAELRLRNDSGATRKRSTKENITYSQKGGFTEGTFVLPGGSQCWFKTVEQFLDNETSFEGPEYDFVWIDEPAPKNLVDTLKFRAGKVGGKVLQTFTAIFGFDATCAELLTGARLVRSLPLNFMWNLGRGPNFTEGNEGNEGEADPLMTVPVLDMTERQIAAEKSLPPGHMPYIMQPLDPRAGVIFAWTQWNVFARRSETNPHVPAIFDECALKPKRTVRMRLFGWAEKLAGCQFPLFDVNVHASEAVGRTIDQLLKEGALTSYLAGDPQTARSYFLLWRGVDRRGRSFIFDESPRIEEGEWVGADGKKADGQSLYAGLGVNWYKNYIRQREREHGTRATRRFGDPRAFATEGHAADGGKSLFDLFRQDESRGGGTKNFTEGNEGNEGGDGGKYMFGRRADRAEESRPALPEVELYGPMVWEPAKVRRSLLVEAASGSLDMINTALEYDRDKPITAENEPRLYIHPRCVNLIRAMLNWDPIQGERSPWKDPIDVLRYLFGEELCWQDPEVAEIEEGAGW